MGKAIWNPLSGRPCMRGRPESLWYFDQTIQVKIHEDWVIRRKPGPNRNAGILRDYTGRDCDVQDIVQPATPVLRAVRESLMLEAKQRAAGSSPAGGTTNKKYGGISSVG